MTTTTAAVCIIVGSVASGTAIVAQVADVPFDNALSAGAAGVAVLMCWLFLKSQSEMRKEHNETIRTVTTEFSAAQKEATNRFAETQEATTNKFADTTATILRERRESEQQMHSLVRELTQTKKQP